MANVTLTPALRLEYDALFNDCQIRPEKMAEVERLVSQLMGNAARYQSVAGTLGIPWYFVAVIHNMEASQNFTRHLHNGDRLTARTVHVPAGRPRTGTPPFTWEESAVDALSMKRLGPGTDWSLAGTLYQMEGYNGWGYRLYHPHVRSPYLWGYSNHYRSGKYVADGTWSDTAVSRQCGSAVLLRRMAESSLITFPDQPPPAESARPLLVDYARRKPRSAEVIARAEALQRWLNTFPGIFVKVDGWPGERTSDAYRLITGSYLPGDPRAT